MSSAFQKKISLLSLIFGAVILVVILAARAGRDRPVTVSTTQAARQSLSSWISSNGKVEPVEPHVIQAQLTTFVDRVFVKEGDMVTRGQILLTLNSADLRSELTHMKEQLLAAEQERKIALAGGSPEEIAQLENDLAKTNVEIARLRREHESLERLYAKQAATRQELDQNKLALERAEADKVLIEQKKKGMRERLTQQDERAVLRAEEARNAIRVLEEKVRSAQVAAPVSGILYAFPARMASFVRPGDVLAELADLKRVRVRAFVDEPELGPLTEGQPIEVTWDAAPDRSWSGQVEQLPKAVVSRGNRSVGEVLCSVSNEDLKLLPNTNVNVRIRTAERGNSLTIPRAVVKSEGSNRYVFVVEGDKLQKRQIAVGISNATTYEVLSGLTENDRIALPGNVELENGLPVSNMDRGR